MPVTLTDQEAASLVQQAARELGLPVERLERIKPFLHDLAEIVAAKVVTRIYGELRRAKASLAECRKRTTTRGTPEELQLLGRVLCLGELVVTFAHEPPSEESNSVHHEPPVARVENAQVPGLRPDTGGAPAS